MEPLTFREANRRYLVRFWPAMILYAVLCFAAPMVLKAMGSPRLLAVVMGIATGAPIAFVFWLMRRLLRETDEFTRAIQSEAMLTGGGITLSLAVIWGFLELYHAVPMSHEAPALLGVGPAFFLFYGISHIVLTRRHGGSLCEMEFSGFRRKSS